MTQPTVSSQHQHSRRWIGWLDGLLTLYLGVLFAWFVSYQLSGDRLPYISLVTMLAVYGFLPLPFAVAWAIWRHKTHLLLLVLLNSGVFVALWGQNFLPKFPKAAQPQISVLTYNVLGWNEEVAAQVETIRRIDADVVFIQELNP